MFETQSEINFNPPRSYSPEDLQKMRYKIDLDKQVAEKKDRRAREWETKMERDKKYVRNQPFGRHANTAYINQNDLQEIIAKGNTSSPVIDMPQELPANYSSSQPSTRSNRYDGYPQYASYSKPASPQRNDQNGDFQRFYGPNKNPSGTIIPSSSSSSITSQPIKGDAHDPFLLFDPNKEGQNVFNIIPQQDMYDPWGRPGAGAPLVYPPTGQKFTRYSGSLQEKLNTKGPLGFNRRQYSENIDEQRRDLELEQQRRQQEERDHRSNAGDTAEWISQIENTRYPLKLHLPTTKTTREYIGVRDPYEVHESRRLHSHLVEQAEQRARLHQMDRRQNSMADIQHTETQNSWWGRSGGGAPTYTSRRHNPQITFENPRLKWSSNHLGQLLITDPEPPNRIKLYENDYLFPKSNRSSNHKNFYEAPLDNKS